MVAICTPSRDLVNASFSYDLVKLVKANPQTEYLIAYGTYLPNLRSSLVKQAIAGHFSHILFVDSDMRFPSDTITRLLEHNLYFVAANCHQRAGTGMTARYAGKEIVSKGKHGIKEIDTIGFGVALVKTELFFRVPEPWFGMPFDGIHYVGEDIFFCRQVQEKGYKIYIDHDLSNLVKHTGSCEY